MQAAVQTKMPVNQAFFGSFWAAGRYVDCIKDNVQIEGVDRMCTELESAGLQNPTYYVDAFILKTIIYNANANNPTIQAKKPIIEAESSTIQIKNPIFRTEISRFFC